MHLQSFRQVEDTVYRNTPPWNAPSALTSSVCARAHACGRVRVCVCVCACVGLDIGIGVFNKLS